MKTAPRSASLAFALALAGVLAGVGCADSSDLALRFIRRGGTLPLLPNEPGVPTARDATLPQLLASPEATSRSHAGNPHVSPDAPRALAMGGGHACAILYDGRVKCWGRNDFGQLGVGDTQPRGADTSEMGAALPAVDLGTHRFAVAIAAGDVHTCALLDDQSVKCWGKGGSRLGLGGDAAHGHALGTMGDSLRAIAFGADRTATAIAAYGDSTCALLDDGSIKCWGDNTFGQLGQGDERDRGEFASQIALMPAVAIGSGHLATAIAVGGGHACAILDDQSLKCWGRNDEGQLGVGDTRRRGVSIFDMGDFLPVAQVGKKVIEVSLGTSHTCALFEDTTVACWGDNASGQLGYGDTQRRGDTLGHVDRPVPVGKREVVAVSAHGDSTCAVFDDFTLKCWGANASGELGLGDTRLRGDALRPVDVPFVDLGAGRSVATLASGNARTCAGLDDGTVKCWGDNEDGALGIGEAGNRGDDPGEMGDALPAVLLR